MIPGAGAGALPPINGGDATSGIEGDTSQTSTSKGSGLNYNKGNGIPAWVIAVSIIGGLAALVFLKSGKK